MVINWLMCLGPSIGLTVNVSGWFAYVPVPALVVFPLKQVRRPYVHPRHEQWRGLQKDHTASPQQEDEEEEDEEKETQFDDDQGGGAGGGCDDAAKHKHAYEHNQPHGGVVGEERARARTD